MDGFLQADLVLGDRTLEPYVRLIYKQNSRRVKLSCTSSKHPSLEWAGQNKPEGSKKCSHSESNRGSHDY